MFILTTWCLLLSWNPWLFYSNTAVHSLWQKLSESLHKKKIYHGWRGSVIFCVTICISGQKIAILYCTPLRLLQPWQTRFLCRDLGYFWPELAVMISQHKSFCSALYPATQISIKSFHDRFSMEINIDINANLFFQILLKSGQHYPLLLLHFLYFIFMT